MKAAHLLLVPLAAHLPLVGTAAAGPATPAPSGEALFASKCATCHDLAGWGTRALARRLPPDKSELLQRRAVPAALVKLVVRRGIGSMPQFTPTDLSDDELDALARWLESGR